MNYQQKYLKYKSKYLEKKYGHIQIFSYKIDNNNDLDYKQKYLKYKSKYLNIKYGGAGPAKPATPAVTPAAKPVTPAAGKPATPAAAAPAAATPAKVAAPTAPAKVAPGKPATPPASTPAGKPATPPASAKVAAPTAPATKAPAPATKAPAPATKAPAPASAKAVAPATKAPAPASAKAVAAATKAPATAAGPTDKAAPKEPKKSMFSKLINVASSIKNAVVDKKAKTPLTDININNKIKFLISNLINGYEISHDNYTVNGGIENTKGCDTYFPKQGINLSIIELFNKEIDQLTIKKIILNTEKNLVDMLTASLNKVNPLVASITKPKEENYIKNIENTKDCLLMKIAYVLNEYDNFYYKNHYMPK